MSNQSPNPEGQERVVLWRYLDDRPGLWRGPGTPADLDDDIETATFQRIPDDAVCVVLDREDAKAIQAFLGARVTIGRSDIVRVRAALRASLSTSGEGE